MNKTFKTFLFASAAALAIAGCSSYSEVAYWKSPTKINDGETPVATFLTQNFSYQLLGFIPLCTGLPWTSGSEDYMDDFDDEDEDYELGDEDFDFDDDVMYEVTCPKCGETEQVSEEELMSGSIHCPKCGELLEFEFDEDDEAEPEE